MELSILFRKWLTKPETEYKYVKTQKMRERERETFAFKKQTFGAKDRERERL